MNTKSFIAGLAISMTVMGSAMADDLTTMEGIPAEAMSHADMESVEGKFYVWGNQGGQFVLDIQDSGKIFLYNSSTRGQQIGTWANLPATTRKTFLSFAQQTNQLVNPLLAEYDRNIGLIQKNPPNMFSTYRSGASGNF